MIELYIPESFKFWGLVMRSHGAADVSIVGCNELCKGVRKDVDLQTFFAEIQDEKLNYKTYKYHLGLNKILDYIIPK